KSYDPLGCALAFTQIKEPKDQKTGTFDVKTGIPQGSVLSPILFNLLMRNIKIEIDSDINISIYADDVVIWCSSHIKQMDYLEIKLQKNIDIITNYVNNRGLVISPAKTSYMLFGPPKIKNINLVMDIDGTH